MPDRTKLVAGRRRLGVVSVMPATLSVLLLITQQAVAAPLSITPASTTVFVGESFTLDISIVYVVDLFDCQFDVTMIPASSRSME